MCTVGNVSQRTKQPSKLVSQQPRGDLFDNMQMRTGKVAGNIKEYLHQSIQD